ncbi:D-glycero-beta-D-manno-heptose-7-phosphate kinase [Thermodesulfobacterium hydrogeniphilum]|uniref:D-glycero-beta-D-manno-heptose-7-phosphate kinase n=1 Tax=Thermodesulfobacterium hydrogeniphilum TaxID=161156 RepID=UPI00056E5F9C|nr:D-glycero-beta-D-manno-heptose-7-phosphate kinase [Thermodesulfobacterium hydrogeniphilum]
MKSLNLEKLEERLSKVKLLVVGDCILDRYFLGEVNRISPEAPVPVFDLKETYYSLGGAANVAANLRGLNVQVELMGIVGEDDKGKILKELAQKEKIGIKGILEDKSRPTTLKTRIIAYSQHLLRIDLEERAPLNKKLMKRFQEIYEEILEKVDGVIISDYAKGMFLSASFCSWLIGEARRKGRFVLVDPKSIDWKKYEGATAITPNLKEFKNTAFKENLPQDDLEKSAKELIDRYNLDFLVVTLGKDGIFFYHPERGFKYLPAQAKEVYDVSGAGDTVIASLGAFYAAKLPIEKALELANIAAGIVVGKIGTKPIYWEEIKSFIKENFS